MKASMYFNYTSRSLLRGGQRTILAVFCVAVGVMAIVALQLVGFMLQNSFSSNVRDTNGGDIAVTTQSVPFKESDLSFFTHLKSDGAITNYTAVTSANGFLSAVAPSSQSFSVDAVDPNNYPLVSQPTFVTPSNASVSNLLTHTAPTLKMVQGRNVNASDAGSNNVVISELLTNTGPLHMHLKASDTITFASVDDKRLKTVTVVGVYANSESLNNVGSVLASAGTVHALSSTKIGVTTITYMKIDPAQVNHALNTLGQIVPNATVQNTADIGAYFAQQLNSIMDILVAIASLSMIAAIIIIANAVALAMLERRRELGILKSVGYTSGTVLSEVMIENGIVGAVGAFIAMLLATAATALLGSLLFNLTLSVSPLIALSLIGGSALLAMLTAALVAWGSVRVRPLEVLRYE